ncbi:hypothetical protein AAGG74_14930 [Bacillus mexicanus]
MTSRHDEAMELAQTVVKLIYYIDEESIDGAETLDCTILKLKDIIKTMEK